MNRELETGYRLQRFEVFNWGTFNDLHILETNGYTALLTGENGSGKSTLVDAILTLLVPQRGTGGRNYNQAASSGKRERNELSYVRGAYGQLYNNQTGTTQTRFLRKDKFYSVLLAVFDNPSEEKTVTLAQVFWIRKGSLSKFHIVAERSLSISEHFKADHDIGRTLKGELRKLEGVKVYDSFPLYSASLNRKLNLGEKAVTLFNQIVSIKDITGLNEFVREHMLEEYDSQSSIDDLRGYYQNLTAAYEAIEKAEKQLALLNPLLNIVERHRSQQERIIQTDTKITVVPIYISVVQKQFLLESIAELKTQTSQAEADLMSVKLTLEELYTRQSDLQQTIARDDVGQHLTELSRRLKTLQKEQRKREQQARRYQNNADFIELPFPNNLMDFQRNRDLANTQLKDVDSHFAELDRARLGIEIEIKELRQAGQELEQEIKSLRQRKNQIPSRDIQIRTRIVNELNLHEDNFPFVGELLKVRDDFPEWEPVIQRLLNGFGRQMLVPDDYYIAVSEYVEKNNLRGRLVYHRIRNVAAVSEDHLPANALYNRLQIKSGTPFRDWLSAQIINHFSYTCCDSLNDFRQARRAITLNGQVKHGGERHEKDDRSRLGDRTKYVLGWENVEKIRLLESELDKLGQRFEQLAEHIQSLEDEKKGMANRRDKLQNILFFEAFETIDVANVTSQVSQIQVEYDDLQAKASQSQLAYLREELDETKSRIRQEESKRSTLDQDFGKVKSQLNERENRLQRVERTLKPVDIDDLSDLLDEIHTDLQENFDDDLSFDTSIEAERKLNDIYNERKNGQETRLKSMAHGALERMNSFKNIYPAETQDVDASLESAAILWYEEKQNQIEHDDLPRFKAEFEELVRLKITQSVNTFRSGMLDQLQQYRKRIDQLNESLRQISYTTETYIQLVYENTRDQQVRSFENGLRNCFPNIDQDGDEANKVAYLNIRDLINQLETETNWAKKVTDVRRWLDFAAEERKQSDDSQHERYDGSSGKSGGQKAKLAYTIMASAIAYQYGLFSAQRGTNKTFRFVVVDEVFSKSDESNARFAMDLFRQLGLQVLVVTPSDKLHIVEPYIGICHWVRNVEEGNDSRVDDLSVEQLQTRRVEQAGAAD